MQPAPRLRVVSGLAALAVLALVAVAAVLAVTPPAPRADGAPGSGFVAARAYGDVEAIGAAVHVTGSDAAGRVREHIVDTLTGMGLHPEVREGIGSTANLGGPAMAYTRNVVAEIPGTASTGRLILMAHYDSVQVSYGANDDGSGVATLLEVARNLKAGPRLRNDVVLLFTDAEEACLCGAESFVHSDPLGTAGGVVLNFESRGANGPSVMFETAAGNANLVAQYAKAAPYPVATSMAVEVYRILPNDTDFTPFRTSGRFTGLNSAYIDGVPVYHSPEDRPEYMDRGTLQQHGANALAVARQLGGADLVPLAKPAAHDATYFPVLGSLVTYPGTWVWPVAVLALAAVALLGWAIRRRGIAGWGRLAGGFGLTLVPLVLAAMLAQGFWALLVALRPAYGGMTDPWQPTWFRLAVCALATAAVVGWYAAWRRRLTPHALQFGALAWLAVLGLVMAAATPGGSYLAALPALLGAAAATVGLTVRAWWLRPALYVVGGAVAVVILVPTVLLFFPALGLATGAAAALFVAMTALALLPVIETLHPESGSRRDPAGGEDPAAPVHRRRLRAALPTLVVAVLAVALTGVGFAADRFDARHPRPTQLMYAMDADTGQAYWASQQASVTTPWLAHYVTGAKDLSAQFPMLAHPVLAGPAERANLPAPELTVESDTSSGGSRTLTLAVHPRANARLVELDAPGITVRAAQVHAAGVSRAVEATPHGFSLLFNGPPPGGITVTLTVDGTGPVAFRLTDGSDGLGSLPGFVPRPADVGVAGSHTSELVMVARTVTV